MSLQGRRLRCFVAAITDIKLGIVIKLQAAEVAGVRIRVAASIKIPFQTLAAAILIAAFVAKS